MSDPIIDALRAKLKSGEAKPRRGVLRRWMKKNYSTVSCLLAEGLSWDDFVDVLEKHGVKNDHGKRVEVRRAQQTWYAVRKEVEKAREERAEAPPRSGPPAQVPVADAKPEPPAIPVSPGPIRNSEPAPRTRTEDDEFGPSSGMLGPRSEDEE